MADQDDDLVAELEATIKEMDGRLARDGKDVVALITRGEARFDLGEADDALADLKQALALEGQCASTHLAWARVKLDANELDEVLEHVQRAIEIDTINPGHAVDVELGFGDEDRAVAQFMLAEALADKGRHADALKAVERAISLDSESSSFYVLRADLHSEKEDFVKAEKDLAKAIELDPSNMDARVERLRLLVDRGDHEAAVKEVEAALKVAEEEGDDEGHAELLVARGEAWLDSGDSLRAREDFKRAVDIDPQNLDALIGLSEISIKARDFDLADGYLRQAGAIEEDHPVVLFNRGVLERAREKPEAALAALDRCIELSGEYGPAFGVRGLVKADLGREADSKADLDKARELGYEPEGV